LISRIHNYAGLLTLANLMLYAVVGIAALWDTRGAAAPEVWEQPFAAAAESDRATAERVVQLLRLSLATPVHDFAIRHDAGRPLVLDFYHANGRHKVTVLEGRIRVEHTRVSLWKYLSTLHVTTAAFRSGDWRMQLWAWWNEFAMWCLLVMMGSGVWIWLSRRSAKGGWRRAHRYTALAIFALLAIYGVSAVHMAHRTWVKAGPALSWLDKVHRMRGVSFAPVLGVGLVVLSASGMVLWWMLRRDRRAGVLLLALGCAIAIILAAWMRVA
jgi:PepSY-associated TM region